MPRPARFSETAGWRRRSEEVVLARGESALTVRRFGVGLGQDDHIAALAERKCEVRGVGDERDDGHRHLRHVSSEQGSA